jgi:hypothetical protein
VRFMRIAIFAAVVLIGAIACAADKIPEFIENMPIFGRTPPTEQWLWYTEAGPRDRIAPVIYITTQHFETVSPETLIVVSRARYDIVAQFTQSRIARSSCPFEVHKPLPYYAVKLAEHHGGRTQFCMVSQESACEFFADMMRLPGMRWSAAELERLDAFMIGDQCRSIRDSLKAQP